MTPFIQFLTVSLPLAYGGLVVLNGMAFAGDKAPRLAGLRRPALVGVLFVHGMLFYCLAQALGGSPISSTWMLFSAVAFATACLYGIITSRTPQPTAGMVVFSLVTLMQWLASALTLPGAPEEVVPIVANKMVHALTSILASASLILSGLYGLLYILLFRQMRARNFGPLFRQLPTLEQLAGTTRHAALAGFLFLTVGWVVGVGMAHATEGIEMQYLDPYFIMTLVLWLHFGLVAFSRHIPLLPPRGVSFAALAGLVTVMIILLLILLPSVTFHSAT